MEIYEKKTKMYQEEWLINVCHTLLPGGRGALQICGKMIDIMDLCSLLPPQKIHMFKF